MSIFEATDTPVRDITRYGVLYALLTVSVPTAVVYVDETIGVALLGVVVVVALVAASWVTRTGDVGSPRIGSLPSEPAYRVHHVFVDDATSRLHVLLYAFGVTVATGVVIALWVAGVVPSG